MRRIAIAVGSLVFALVSVGGSASATEPTPEADDTSTTPLERVNAYVQPSIVFLQQDWTGYVYDKTNKQYLTTEPFVASFQCTGFVVNPDGYIATAGHCVDYREVLASFLEQAAQWAVDNAYYENSLLTVEDVIGFNAFRVDGETKNGRPDVNIQVGWGASAGGVETSEVKRARVVDYQQFRQGDVALLKVEATDLNAIQLADNADLEVGTEVVSIGYPGSVDSVTDAADFSPSYKEGSISSVKTVEGGLLTVYETSAAVSGGMSGGPTVNLDGEVVGVNSFSPASESQSFNFIRPSAQINELIAGAGVENELSEMSTTYRDGLDAFFAGDKEKALAAFETVVDEQPTNELAQQYLDKAEDMPAPKADVEEESGSGLPILPIVIGLVVLALVGAVLAFVLMRRKKPTTPGPVAAAPYGGPTQPMGGPAAALPSGPAPVMASSGSPTPTAETSTARPMGFVSPPPGAPPPPAAPVTPATTVPPAAPPTAAAPPAPPPVVPPADTAPIQMPPAEPAAPAEPALLAFCPSCGTKADQGQRFCGKCGTSLLD